LVEILRDSRCIAVVRGIDGSASPVTGAELIDGVKVDEKVSASIRGPQGAPLAFVDLLPKEGIDSQQTKALLLAIAESTANAITERFFRIHYRQQWIMAGQCTGRPGKRMLLAVDREYRVVGADYQAQDMLRSRGTEFEPGLSLTVFFRMNPSDLRGGRHFETLIKLTGHDDDGPWYVLATSPDLGRAILSTATASSCILGRAWKPWHHLVNLRRKEKIPSEYPRDCLVGLKHPLMRVWSREWTSRVLLGPLGTHCLTSSDCFVSHLECRHIGTSCNAESHWRKNY
jgi:hypothetical protein